MKALLAPMDNLCFPDYRINHALADDICRFLCPKIINNNNNNNNNDYDLTLILRAFHEIIKRALHDFYP